MCLVSVGLAEYQVDGISANLDNSGSDRGHNQPCRHANIRSIT